MMDAPFETTALVGRTEGWLPSWSARLLPNLIATAANTSMVLAPATVPCRRKDTIATASENERWWRAEASKLVHDDGGVPGLALRMSPMATELANAAEAFGAPADWDPAASLRRRQHRARPASAGPPPASPAHSVPSQGEEPADRVLKALHHTLTDRGLRAVDAVRGVYAAAAATLLRRRRQLLPH